MRQLSRQDVAEDFEIAMRMRRKSGIGFDSVFIQHSQRAELCELGIEPVRKGEAVICVEPAVVAMSTGAGPMRRDFSLTKNGLGHVASRLDHGRVSVL